MGENPAPNNHLSKELEKKVKEIRNGLMSNLNALNVDRKKKFKELISELLVYFNKLDIRLAMYEILEKYENLILSGFINSDITTNNPSIIDTIDNALKYINEKKQLIIDSVNAEENKDFADLNYTTLRAIIGVFAYAKDFPKAGNSFTQYIFNIDNEDDIIKSAINYERLSILLSMSLFYGINSNSKGFAENIPRTKVSESELLLQMNSSSYVLTRFYPEFNFDIFRRGLDTQLNSLLNDLIRTDELKKIILNAANNTFATAEPEENKVENQNNNIDNISERQLDSDIQLSIPVPTYDKTENQEIFDKISTFGLSIEMDKKAKKQAKKLNNFNWDSVSKIFQSIANSDGSLESFVSRFRDHKGLSPEYLKGSTSGILSVRINRRDRLCLTQSKSGEITILSFGSHYNF